MAEVPSWLKHYIDGIPEGQAEFLKLNARYQAEIDNNRKLMGGKLEGAKEWAQFTGQRQTLTAEEILEGIKESYKTDARALAKEYVGSDETLNRINPEIQVEPNPKKVQSDSLSSKQDAMKGKIDNEKAKLEQAAERQKEKEKSLVMIYKSENTPGTEKIAEMYKNILRQNHGMNDTAITEEVQRVRQERTAAKEAKTEKPRIRVTAEEQVAEKLKQQTPPQQQPAVAFTQLSKEQVEREEKIREMANEIEMMLGRKRGHGHGM